MDTIYALATARGKAGVAVIRVSGPDAFNVCRQLASDVPLAGQHRLLVLRALDGQLLDKALVLAFAAPNSFSGENIVEFQVHGSSAVVQAVQSSLAETQLCRLAEPGEFTRRAMLNNKLDLVQVEGLGDLIEAETEVQRRQAMNVFTGKLRGLVDCWRGALIRAIALIEVTIDFADEDVPVDVMPEVSELVLGVLADLRIEIAGSYVSERVRDGFEVAIVGPPNVGKSTLLNALAGREAAITSSIAGTTRDVIEVRMDLGGLPVTFLDTAGLREATDEIEKIGVSRALERAERADLRVYLRNAETEIAAIVLSPNDVSLIGKGDLLATTTNSVSGKTGFGVDRLVQDITDRLSNLVATSGTATHERHRLAMQAAVVEINLAVDEITLRADRPELVAEHLRNSTRALDMLIGRVDVENVLDEIFSRFCLGK